MRAIADALGMSHDAYLDMVAEVLDADAELLARDGAEAEEGRRVQQVLAMTALSHVRRFNPRSFYALQRLGVLRDPPPELSADQLAAFTDPAHPTRISASPGPFVFLHEPTRPGEGQAFSVLVFLLDANRAVRDAAVRFFLGAPQEADSWLSPRSHAAAGIENPRLRARKMLAGINGRAAWRSSRFCERPRTFMLLGSASARSDTAGSR